MIVVYFAIAMALIFTDKFVSLQQPNRKILAAIIFLYAIFKSYKVVMSKKNIDVDEHK